jgi:cytochrome c peroxidase
LIKRVIILSVIGILGSFTIKSIVTPYKFEKIDYFPIMPISADNPVTIEGVELGRFLFYDSILSKDYSISCASCHQQKFAFSDSVSFSKGITKEKLIRNTMPLYNLAWYPKMFWDGRVSSIEEQVFFPVRADNEMGLDWSEAEKRIKNSMFYKPLFFKAFGNKKIDSVLISKAIAQFERTLISNNSKFDRVLEGKDYLTPEEYEGYGLVNDQTKGGCLHCHITDGNGLGTNLELSNNGLDKLVMDSGYYKITKHNDDIGKFKVPSLRNLGFTAPYMHDGRFKTIDEVLDFYSDGVQSNLYIDSKMTFAHQGGNHLTKDEKRKIIMFLNTLNDTVFISNTEFSNPFE